MVKQKEMEAKYEHCTANDLQGFAFQTILTSQVFIENCDKVAHSIVQVYVWEVNVWKEADVRNGRDYIG